MNEIINQIQKKAKSGEIFKVSYKATPVEFEMNRLKVMNMEEIEGWALRIIRDGRIGFSTSTSQQQMDRMIERALDVSQFGQQARFDFPQKIDRKQQEKIKLFDLSVQSMSLEEMIQTGNEMIRQVSLINPDLRCDAGVTKQEGYIQYWNTYGTSFEYQKTTLSQAIMVQDIKENDMLMLMESQDWGNQEMSPDNLWRKIGKKLEWSKKIVEISSNNMPVIFTPKALLILMLPIISGLNGKLINQQISPLQNKKGQELWSPLLSIYSDGLIDYAQGSAPFDDEGITTQCLPLVEKGMLKNYYYDLQSAAEAGVEPTGNGIRAGFHSSPSPGINNLIVSEGRTSFEEMIEDTKEGIIVDQVLGLGQGNVLSGAFSNNVQLGFKIMNGKVVGRIKNVMISGNAYEVLKDIVAVGNESTWLSGQYCFPPVKVKSLSVSTKE